jgi:hypothetical protein
MRTLLSKGLLNNDQYLKVTMTALAEEIKLTLSGAKRLFFEKRLSRTVWALCTTYEVGIDIRSR